MSVHTCVRMHVCVAVPASVLFGGAGKRVRT